MRFFLLLTSAGCIAQPEANIDANTQDGGAFDAFIDASPFDLGTPDADALDAFTDASPSDLGTLDADALDAFIDASPSDLGTPDAGALDAFTDASPSDLGEPDAGISSPDVGFDAGPQDSGSLPCVLFEPSIDIGTVASGALNEISGLAESRAHPGVLWVHNDAGGGAVLYAIQTTGDLLATFVLTGAPGQDWEDIAIASYGGGYAVFIGDIGDNAARTGVGTPRTMIYVVRLMEPSVVPGQAPTMSNLSSWEKLPMTYPNHAHDAESLFVDPLSGDMYIVTKEANGQSILFRNPAPHVADVPVVLEPVGNLTFGSATLPGNVEANSADFSPAGDSFIIRTYSHIFLWERPSGTSMSAALLATPHSLPRSSEPQGEAVGFAHDGLGYFTISEGAMQPIRYFAASQPCR